MMDETELFTVNVFQSREKRASDGDRPDAAEQIPSSNAETKHICQFQNMVSARVIKGRTLELEHSNLAGPEVKFKTVINYERTLEPKSFLGVTFNPQEGYMTKSEKSEEN